MKFKHLLLTAALILSVSAFAQPEPPFGGPKPEREEEEGYKFEIIKELPITPVKDQNRAGTCWCYSTLGFFEAELLRMGKPEYDFSEMYIVYKTYQDRADKAVRTHGDVSFSQGGSFGDVIYAIKHYGLVPDEEMRAGQMHGDSLSDFSEFSTVCDPFIEAVATKCKTLQVGSDENHTPLWKTAFNGILDAYIGKCPEEFKYKGKKYDPMSFAKSTGLNMDDYVNIASFAHQPWYEPFVIEVQDNWRWGTAYNLPIDEFMEILNNAIDNDYPIAWGADVSEKGWLRGKMAGVCVLPDLENQSDKSGTDYAHWNGLSMADRQKEAMSKPTPQRWVNDQDRLDAYNNFETTDDHGMVIYGKAKDQMGNVYFMVKNSWGDAGSYHGIWYASEAFVRYKTLNCVVHKDAIPKNLKKKLGIK